MQLDSYDSNGNLVSRTGGYTYSYDDENRLTTWVLSNAKTEFYYDGLGRLRTRIEYVFSGGSWVTNSTTRYVYDGWRVIQERDTSNPLVSYTRGNDLSGSLEGAGGIGGLLARSHAYQPGSGSFTNHNYYHADGNGNITYLVTTNQGLAASYRYDPFGNTVSSSGSLASANVYRFSSKEIHVNSGLYYYGFRWYAPNLQRWLNRDPLEEYGGINLYRFTGNYPIGWIDPLGLAVSGPTNDPSSTPMDVGGSNCVFVPSNERGSSGNYISRPRGQVSPVIWVPPPMIFTNSFPPLIITNPPPPVVAPPASTANGCSLCPNEPQIVILKRK